QEHDLVRELRVDLRQREDHLVAVLCCHEQILGETLASEALSEGHARRRQQSRNGYPFIFCSWTGFFGKRRFSCRQLSNIRDRKRGLLTVYAMHRQRRVGRKSSRGADGQCRHAKPSERGPRRPPESHVALRSGTSRRSSSCRRADVKLVTPALRRGMYG